MSAPKYAQPKHAQSPEELEAALPSLVNKLKELQATLSPQEQVVFGEIIESAALHTQSVQADDEGIHDKILFAKPKSVHSTTKMKAEYLKLPATFGLKSDD